MGRAADIGELAGEAAASAGVLSEAVLGAGLPELAERHLRLAARAYHEEAIAEAHLRKALAVAPGHAAVLIGLYRFYFYKNRLEEALDVARTCVRKAAADNGLPTDWRAVRREDAAFSDFSAVLPRFYLFALKACAYLNLRLGAFGEGGAVLDKLLELDPADKIGARVLVSVLGRMGEDDDG